ncbi:hypothetical protein [Streptomyces sp. NPDC001851]|uniref:hypothetical protein n=1 Tax=Streptomyces sp. NPDC001851 TaxID=3154529 RepID=UPI0033325F34
MERALRAGGRHPARSAVGEAVRGDAVRGDDREDAVVQGAQDAGAALGGEPLGGAGQRAVPAHRAPVGSGEQPVLAQRDRLLARGQYSDRPMPHARVPPARLAGAGS